VDARNAQLLDRAAEALAGQRITGAALRVERIPMPPRPDGLFRTYTNVILVNDLLLVPQYPTVCPELDAQALALYRRLLPGHEVVGIDAESLIQRHGALHCISLTVPEAATRLP